MAKKKKVPVRESNKVKDTDKVRDYVSSLVSNVMTDDRDRGVFLRKLENAWAQRMMLVDQADVPWPGAPNFSMPFTDKQIRKRKSTEVAGILNPKKMALVSVEEGVPDPTGQLREKARRAEMALNLMLRKKMTWTENLILGIDYRLEKGRTYFKIFERFESKYVNRTISINDMAYRIGANEIKAAMEQNAQQAQQAGQPIPKTEDTIDLDQALEVGKDILKVARQLKNREIIELIIKNTGFGFDINNDDHMVTLDSIVRRFKSGEQEIDFTMEIINSSPAIEAVPPERIILPANSPRNTQLLTRFAHEYFMNEYQLMEAVDRGQFKREVVEEAIKSNEANADVDKRPIEVDKDSEEGISPTIEQDGSLYKIWEIHSYWKEKEGTVAEKYVFTVFAKDNTGDYLRIIKEPNDDGFFPLVAIDNEVVSDRATSSRGFPEMLRYVQGIIDMQENNRMRRDIVQNTPFFTIRRQSGITSNSYQYIPGQNLVVDNHDDMMKQNAVNGVEINAERIEASAKQFGEEYVGSIDFAFAGAQNSGVGSPARTFGEIQAAQSEASKITSLDFITLNEGISKVYEMVFKILRSSMTNPLEINGEVVTREDFNFPFEVRANGNLEASDSQATLQRAISKMQIVMSQDPNYVTLEDKYNAYRDVLESLDVKDVDKYSTNPIEVMSEQAVQLQQQVAQMQQQIQQMAQQLQEGTRDLVKIKQDQQKQIIENEVKRESPDIKTRIIRQVSSEKQRAQ